MEKCFMRSENQVKNLLEQEFEKKRVSSTTQYFIASIQKFEQGDWDGSLSKAGKFIEAVIKMLWVYAGKSLPTKQKDFKAGVFAQKIINGEISSSEISEDGVRLGIPRASVFIYNITSNRGARHDSDEITPNEMDASTILPLCSWILAELVRFSAKNDIDDAKEIINSLIERKYPIFEEIDDRIYVDHKKFKGANECGLLLLYGIYPNRIAKDKFIACLKLHKFKQSAIKLERLTDYIDIDKNNNILLRATGRRKAEEILNK
jgi:hypothetical protein